MLIIVGTKDACFNLEAIIKDAYFFSILNVIKDAYFFLTGYPTMQFYMNKTGHPMVFSCEWPLYENGQHIKVGT